MGEGFRARFERDLAFPLDGFQRRSMDAIDRGESVLVSAPTGSGKTLIAEYAAARALRSGGKAFYTTPIKALSNQKFAELSLRYGEDRVGLLTGDVSHQARAPIVVMTTEVLRNMLFARSPLLDDLAVVVLDEVHYLQDPYRGSVWEEVLVLAPPGVRFVSLSATVSNATDFGAWLTSVRGTTRVDRGDPPAGDPPPSLRRRRAGQRPADRAPAAPGREGQPRRCRPRRAPPPEPAATATGPPGGPRWSSTWPTRTCCPPSPSSSRGRPATTPPGSACRTGSG